MILFADENDIRHYQFIKLSGTNTTNEGKQMVRKNLLIFAQHGGLCFSGKMTATGLLQYISVYLENATVSTDITTYFATLPALYTSDAQRLFHL